MRAAGWRGGQDLLKIVPGPFLPLPAPAGRCPFQPQEEALQISFAPVPSPAAEGNGEQRESSSYSSYLLLSPFLI